MATSSHSEHVYTLHEAESLAAELHRTMKTKKAKQEHAKRLLYADELGEGGIRFAVALLGSHADRAEKIGEGVVDVVARPALYGTRCFHAVRVDGSSTDFSYLKCLTPPLPLQNVTAACRLAVRGQIDAFRRKRMTGNPFCDLTGLPVHSSEAHVHHAPPMFDQLVLGWLEFCEMTPEEMDDELVCGDNVQGLLIPEPLRQDWLNYHGQAARLQYVHPVANRQVEAARRSIKARS